MTAITTILYWIAYFIITSIILLGFISVNIDAVKAGWAEYRCSAYLRLIRIKIKRSTLSRYSYEMRETGSASI